MTDWPQATNSEFFERKYARLRSSAARAVEAEVLGHAVGLNGFTTVQEARELATVLELHDGQRLLDVGAGRGWPGSLIASVSGCRLTSTDIPMNALVDARDHLAAAALRHRAHVAAADVLALPFRRAVFDAVAQADVFC